MSRLRENTGGAAEGDLSSPLEGDLAPWVIFTQLVAGGPYVYAGWLDATDAAMALQFAREHYGRDQECTAIWAIPRSAIAGTERDYPPSSRKGPRRAFRVFARRTEGDAYVSGGSVEAESSEEALRMARAGAAAGGEPGGVWVVPLDRIAATGDDEVVWRLTDQSYRLARGYSAAVRAKWERVRAERDIREYEKEDLKEAF